MAAIERLVVSAAQQVLNGENLTLSVPSRAAGNQEYVAALDRIVRFCVRIIASPALPARAEAALLHPLRSSRTSAPSGASETLRRYGRLP